MSIEEKLCSNGLMEIVYDLHRTNHKVARGQFQVSTKLYDPILVNSITYSALIRSSKGMIFNDVSL